MKTGSEWLAGISALVVAVALVTATHSARAEALGNPNNAPIAEQLFLEGKRLLGAGQTRAACEKLSASYAVETGLGTLLLLGHCYEALGKTASAWAQFRSAESLAAAAGQPRRAEIARLRAAALEPQLSRLMLLRPQRGDSTTYEIVKNGQAVPPASLDVALPVDPGRQVIEVSAPGRQKQRLIVDVPVGPGTARVSVPWLAPAAKVRTGVASTQNRKKDVSSRPPLRSAPSHAPSYVTGALGIAGVGVGTTLGIMAKSAYDDSGESCRTETLCSKPGLQLRETADERALWSTIAFAGGGALLTTAVVLWLAAPETGPTEVVGSASAQRRGTRLVIAPALLSTSAELSLLGEW